MWRFPSVWSTVRCSRPYTDRLVFQCLSNAVQLLRRALISFCPVCSLGAFPAVVISSYSFLFLAILFYSLLYVGYSWPFLATLCSQPYIRRSFA